MSFPKVFIGNPVVKFKAGYPTKTFGYDKIDNMKNFITIGGFDGAHPGHRHLIYVLRDLSAQNKMNSLVMTFPCPPRLALCGGPVSLITTPGEKFKLLKDLGADKIIKLDFAAVQNLTAQEFFDMLLKKYKMGGILAGPDFAFGKNREGNTAFLRAACKAHDIIYVQADFVHEGGRKISSSAIRSLLKAGDMAGAALLLGRPYGVEGKIIKGRQLGRTIGFPTANIDVDETKILPRGVFAVKVFLGKDVFNGVCNIGTRPTVDGGNKPLVEVNIFNFNRNIYGRRLKINFTAKIRDEIKFKSIEDLTAQIIQDAAAARKILLK